MSILYNDDHRAIAEESGRVLEARRQHSLREIAKAAIDGREAEELLRRCMVPLAANPNVRVIITEHGGHCGFVTRPEGGSDGYWAETQVIDFARELCAATPSTESVAARTQAPGPAPRV